MGDSLHVFHSRTSLDPRLITSKKLPKSCLVASTSKGFSQKTLKCITSVKQGIHGSRTAGDIGLFLLTTAALEIVRRLSKAKCPFVWRGLQALQLLCYPPFRWIQRWTPFKGLVKNLQTLSKPLLALTIATVFSDQLPCTKGTMNSIDDSQAYSGSQSEPASQLSTLDTRSGGEVPKDLVSEKWLLELHKELDKQGITLPERLDVDELRRFYAASNFEFSRFLSSVKKTINWRQTYTILSCKELEAWLHWVFWHGCDVKQRPCLFIRLGLACSNMRSNERPLFARAVVSQIEHGIMNLVDVEHPQITVLMDCEGLSPFGFPMQMMRSCAILLQDHYPRRLGCLIIIRLPPVARVITQALFQVLKPATRKKLRIIGHNYPEVLSEYLLVLPSFLGGECSCSKCSDLDNIRGTNEEIGDIQGTNVKIDDIQGTNEEIFQTRPRLGFANDSYVPSSDLYKQTETSLNRSREQVIRTAIIAVLMSWIFIAFIFGMYYPESIPLLYS